MAEIDGNGRHEREMFRAEFKVIEDDGVHGLGLAPARHHADGSADVEMQRPGECVVDAQRSGAAVENGVGGLPVERDGYADEIVVQMEWKLRR